MPYVIDMSDDGKGIVVTLSGVITGQEAMAANNTVVERMESHGLAWQAWDMSSAERFDITTEQLRALAIQDSNMARKKSDHKVALVGTRELFAGADEIYSIFSDVRGGFEMQRFDRMADAMEWVKG